LVLADFVLYELSQEECEKFFVIPRMRQVFTESLNAKYNVSTRRYAKLRYALSPNFA
jgi:hypothetical protein